MEKMSWPPAGSMGPIFGEYLFIRFFTRAGEETGDQRFWSADKFQELLMQLRYNVIPDDSLITNGNFISVPTHFCCCLHTIHQKHIVF